MGAAYASAELPKDADRTIDSYLAGFLYTQGLYKATDGFFKPLQRKSVVQLERLKIPAVAGKDSEVIERWLKSQSPKIEPKEVFR